MWKTRSVGEAQHQSQQAVDGQHGCFVEATDNAADLVARHDLWPVGHDLRGLKHPVRLARLQCHAQQRQIQATPNEANFPTKIPTTQNPQTDTATTNERCSAPAGEAVPTQAAPKPPPAPQATKPVRPERMEGTVLKLSTEELVRLAPRLRPYLTVPTPTWTAIVDAADWLRGELGVSKSLWGEACLAMGREEAAIAVAIVSAKPVGHFRSSPGGYFHGMVAKAKVGELNLAQTIWGLRSRERRTGGGAGRSPQRAN